MVEPKKSIKNIKPYIKESLPDDYRLKLDDNENIYGASKFVISTAKAINPEEIAYFSDFDGYTKKIAQIYGLNHQNCLSAGGLDDALNVIFNTYLEKDDKLVCYNPVCERVVTYAKSTGAEVKYINYENENFAQNADEIRKNLIDGAKICYISTPNDITGQTIRASAIINILREFQDTLFVVDVSYISFVENVNFKDYTDLAEQFSNIVVVKSYANDYALAGLGFTLIVSDKNNIENLKVIAPNSVNIISLKCAISAINDINYIETVKKENLEAKMLLYNGLLALGYKTYLSDTNFILCDFKQYSEFFYNKLKNNGVIVKKFEKDSPIATCLRITVPKTGGVKYILKLLEPKNVIVFAFEDTLFDVKNSYYSAILKTFEYFAKYKTKIEKIKNVKRMHDCTYPEALRRFLLEEDININLKDIQSIFSKIFYGQSDTENRLMDNDKLLIQKDIFESLMVKYDIVLVCDRLKQEAEYALKKFNIEKYFSYIEPDSFNISNIIANCPHKEIALVVSNEEILSCAKRVDIKSIGLVDGENNNSMTMNNFKHYGCDDFIYESKRLTEYFEDET